MPRNIHSRLMMFPIIGLKGSQGKNRFIYCLEVRVRVGLVALALLTVALFITGDRAQRWLLHNLFHSEMTLKSRLFKIISSILLS